jgi:hypothetical protein
MSIIDSGGFCMFSSRESFLFSGGNNAAVYNQCSGRLVEDAV